ncbi:TRAP transporter small permease subunit [Propylenella binzhouense]|nr:TRAP transporter small permease [Propylenella binzhouense]
MADRGARIQDLFLRVGRGASLAGGVLLLASAVLICVEIVSRKLLNRSLTGADELSGYAYALSMAWGFGFVALRGEHVRVDALRVRLSARLRSILDVVALGAFASLMAVLVMRATGMFLEGWRLGAKSNTPLSTPLWIPQSIWLAGLVFCLATLVLLFLRSALALARGDLAAIETIAEPRSGAADIEIADAAG